MNPFVAQDVCQGRVKQAMSEGKMMAAMGAGLLGLTGLGVGAEYAFGKRDARQDIEAGAMPNQSRPQMALLGQLGYDNQRRRLMADQNSERAAREASAAPPPPE